MGNDAEIIEYLGELPPDWDQYSTRHPNGSWYHTGRWRNVICQTFGVAPYYLAAHIDGRIAGILPLSLVSSSLFGRILVSPAFGRYGDICADSEYVQQILLDRAKRLAEELQVDYLEIRSVRSIDDAQLLTKSLKQSFWLELESSVEEQWKAFRSEIRNRARKAESAGCVTQIGGTELLKDFYHIFSIHMRELGTPVYDRRLFSELFDAFGDDVRIVLTSISGSPVGAGILLFYGDSVEVPWISSVNSAFKAYPNNAMYMRAINHAIERECRIFDFGTSTAGSGNAQFKQRWGAQPIQLNWQYYLVEQSRLPDLSPNNDKYAFAIKVWQKLPLWIANRLGPLLTRGIP